MHLQGNNSESGRDKFMEQPPNLEWHPHKSQPWPELLQSINFSCTTWLLVLLGNASQNRTPNHQSTTERPDFTSLLPLDKRIVQ